MFSSKEVCLFGAYLAPLPYGSTKKNLVLRSGAALDNNNMFTPFVAEHLNLIIQTVPVYCYEYKNGEESKSLMTGEQ